MNLALLVVLVIAFIVIGRLIGARKFGRLFASTTRVVGILALPAFLVMWYWARDLTFLTKSAVLVASGAALLGARIWMRLRGFDRETTT